MLTFKLITKKAVEEAMKIVEIGSDMGIEIKGNKEEIIRRIVNMELRDISAYLKKIRWGCCSMNVLSFNIKVLEEIKK